MSDISKTDLKVGKIIWHLIRGKLKIKDIKTTIEVLKIYQDIQEGDFTLKQILKLKFKDLKTAIEFNNHYTNLDKISFMDILTEIRVKVENFKDSPEYYVVITLLSTLNEHFRKLG
jgi:hypothetical protein